MDYTIDELKKANKTLGAKLAQERTNIDNLRTQLKEAEHNAHQARLDAEMWQRLYNLAVETVNDIENTVNKMAEKFKKECESG